MTMLADRPKGLSVLECYRRNTFPIRETKFSFAQLAPRIGRLLDMDADRKLGLGPVIEAGDVHSPVASF